MEVQIIQLVAEQQAPRNDIFLYFLVPCLVLLQGRKPDCENIAETSTGEVEPTLLIQPGDIVPKEPGSSEETLRVLLRPSDKVANHYKTTSSEINAIVGAVPSICKHVPFLVKLSD